MLVPTTNSDGHFTGAIDLRLDGKRQLRANDQLIATIHQVGSRIVLTTEKGKQYIVARDDYFCACAETNPHEVPARDT